MSELQARIRFLSFLVFKILILPKNFLIYTNLMLTKSNDGPWTKTHSTSQNVCSALSISLISSCWEYSSRQGYCQLNKENFLLHRYGCSKRIAVCPSRYRQPRSFCIWELGSPRSSNAPNPALLYIVSS